MVGFARELEIEAESKSCEHNFTYAGVRYCHGHRTLPGSGATRRYYAHVYFCSKCTETRGEPIEDPCPNDPVWSSYSNIQFNATPGTADQCGVSKYDRERY
jgi:hypothetical protein